MDIGELLVWTNPNGLIEFVVGVFGLIGHAGSYVFGVNGNVGSFVAGLAGEGPPGD